MSTAIIYLNYFSSDQIKDSVKSLIAQLGTNDHIYIGDNSADDEEFERLESLSSEKITVIRNSGNIGFSAGCNKVCDMINGSPEWVLLLNPDTLVGTGFMSAFRKRAELLDDSWVALSPLGFLMGTQNIWSAGGKFYWLRGRADVLKKSRISGRTEFGTCACLFVRRHVFIALGGLDEDYFLGGEEWQLSYDITNKLNKKIFYDNEVIYEHAVSGTHEKYGLKYFFIGIRSKLIFVTKNYSQLGKIIFWLSYVPYQCCWIARYSVRHNISIKDLGLATMYAFKLQGKKMDFSQIKERY